MMTLPRLLTKLRSGGAPASRGAAVHPAVPQLDALTALRFGAAAYVVVFHYAELFFPASDHGTFVALGYTGVTFFFVLSGFILAYNYRTVDFADGIARAKYLRARLARVYPVYLFALLVSVPWFINWTLKTAPPLQGLMAMGGLLAPLGLHAWLPGAACSLDCPSWSISVEAFFYLLFPILLPLVMRRPGAVTLASLTMWFVFASGAVWLWNLVGDGASLIKPEAAGPLAILTAQFIKYCPMMRLPEFLAGLLLFAAWQRARLPTAALLAVAGMAAAGLVMSAAKLPEPLLHNGLTALAWAPLILAGAQIRRGVLTTRAFVFLGRISFALYLLHTPVYALMNTLDRVALKGLLAAHPWFGAGATVAAALVVSALVHLWIEEPARRRLLRGFGRPGALPAAA